jgi:hypothetical protein
MSSDRFGYWPEGSAYQTPKPAPDLAPICPSCGARHRGKTVTCDLTNEAQEGDHDATD